MVVATVLSHAKRLQIRKCWWSIWRRRHRETRVDQSIGFLTMRTNVTFRHPAQFVALSDEGRILAVNGALWFAMVLQRVPALQIDDDLCQEDWGVVLFARRRNKTFWIGLSGWQAE